MGRPPSDLPERIVRAAVDLAAAAGIRAVTFDAVAARVGASKGAVMHHFRTRGALVEAMVAALVADHRAAVEAACGRDPHPTGRFARALLHVATSSAGVGAERGLLAALIEEPERAEVLRAHYRWCRERLALDGLPPMNATIVLLAGDGLWLAELAGLPTVDPEEMDAVVAALDALTRVAAAPDDAR